MTETTQKSFLARKSFPMDTRNQFEPLENVVEEQSNNNDLNMAEETTNNLRNSRTITAQKYDEKLPTSTDPAAYKFIHLM